MALSSQVALTLAATLTGTVGKSSVSGDIKASLSETFADGTGAGQANKVYSATRTLGASASEDLDLAGAALLDIFGAAVAFVEVVAILIHAAEGNTNNVVVGAAATNPWVGLLNATGTITLQPGQWFCATAGKSSDAIGFPVTAGTGDLLKVLNGAAGSSVSYDIYVIGRSA
jgi:hypothetical protein